MTLLGYVTVYGPVVQIRIFNKTKKSLVNTVGQYFLKHIYYAKINGVVDEQHLL